MKFREGVDPATASRLMGTEGAARAQRFVFRGARRLRRSSVERWWRVQVARGRDPRVMMDRLSRNPAVERVQLDYEVRISELPSDPQFQQLWGLDNTGQTGGTQDADIDAPEAWDIAVGDPSIVVAVIDSGVDYTHPDLAANVWTNPGEIPGNSIDDDANGYVDDVHGYDFFSFDGNPMDENGHGTHVAGTIAAVGNNGIGVTGVAWSASIQPVRFLGPDGSGFTSGAIDAILYAAANGARILNNSWGGGGYSPALEDAIEASAEAGTLFVAAGGNSASDNDSAPHYPSSYEVANVIAVAATDSNDFLASFSNYGKNSVDLAAPGANVFSTYPGSGYASLSGTSMAAPHVSGAVAVLLSRFPGSSLVQVKDRLLFNTDPVSSLGPITVTGGRLNLFRALEEDEIPPDPATDLAVVTTDYSNVTLSWTASGDDGAIGIASRYDLRSSTSPLDPLSFDNATPVRVSVVPGPAGSLEAHVVPGLSEATTYHFALRIVDNAGNQSLLSNVVTTVTKRPAIVFSDDFESGSAAWTITGTDGNGGASLWHLSSHRYRSPSTSFYYGVAGQLQFDTGFRNFGEITSPPVDLTGIESASLRFHHYLRTENAPSFYDVAQVRVSADGGFTWAAICPLVDTPEATLVESTCDLSAFDGFTIQVQFRFDTVDAALNYFEGFVIDDVEVLGAGSENLPVADPGGPYTAFKNEPLFFDGTSSFHPGGLPLQYFWDFGDGSTDAGPTPVKVYWTGGTHPVTLVVSDGVVSSLPATTTATVINRPPVAYPGGPYAGIEGVPVVFDGTASYDPDFDFLAYSWQFGDGATGAGATPTHVYGAPGTYLVTLYVDDGEASSSPASTTAQIIVGETVPPAAVSDLAAETFTYSRAIALSWTATGDDGSLGIADRYDVRYSTEPIDETNFDAATPVPGLPAPRPPGGMESHVVSGLVPMSNYWIALKVLDEAGNASGISNVVLAATLDVAEMFRDDLESGVSRWTITGTDGKGGPALWHLSNHRVQSPENAFYYGIEAKRNYDTGARNYGTLELTPLDLHGYRGSWLSFFHFFQTEGTLSYDVLKVEASVDSGLTWSTLFRRSTSTTGGMVEKGIDLSLFDETTVRLRFSFDTVDSGINAYEGWVLDDFVLTVDRVSGMPDARPGGPYESFRNTDVVFDGAQSSDPDGDPLTYAWDFGDGTSGTGPTPAHRYSSPGTYLVALVVSDGTLRSVPRSTTVTVSNRAPSAHPGGPYSGPAELPLRFDGNLSSDADGDALTYHWSFGDGGTATGAAPTHVYLLPGSYTVSLTVHDGFESSTGAVTVAAIGPEVVPPAPVTDLAVSGMSTRTVSLTWTASGDNGSIGAAALYDLRYSEAPIDVDSFPAAHPVPSLPVPKPAGSLESKTVAGLDPDTPYYFALRVLDEAGNASALSNVAAATTRAEMVLFSDDMESGALQWAVSGSDGAGGPALWHIANHRVQSPTSAFYYGRDDTRTYETGARNFGSLTSIPIDLRGHRYPRLVFHHFFDTQAETTADLLRTLASTDAGATWTTVYQRSSATSGGMVEESADLSAYEGQLVRVRFDVDTVDALENGHEGWFIDDVVLAVEARAGLPTADAGGAYFGFRRLPVIFDGAGSSDPDGDALTYFWSFGDGTTGTGPTPAHSYTAVGNYTVSLVVHDGFASSRPDTTTVTVENRPPIANPGGPYSGYSAAPVAFDGSGSSDPEGDPLTYSWSFGDGSSSTSPSPSHTYASPGDYEVTLVVADGLKTSTAVTSVAIVAPELVLTSPNTPLTWPTGSTQTFTWTGNLPTETTVRLEVSPNSGANWILVDAAAPNSGSYAWKVKPPHSSKARARVSWTLVPAVADASDADFTIGSPAYRVKNINNSLSTSWPTNLTNVRGTLFFVASDVLAHGTELWKSDGTEGGTVLVKDITLGPAGTDIDQLTAVGGLLYFTARSRRELWRSDGTTSGTVLVGSFSGFTTVYDLTAVGDTLFFQGCGTSAGCELWRATRTGGASLVKDIVPGSGHSSPVELTAVGNTLFFSAHRSDTGRELWKSDGTPAGTLLVKDIGIGSCCYNGPMYLTNVGGTLFFSAAQAFSSLFPDRELWKSDGTAEGTVQVKNEAYTYLSLFIQETEAVGNRLFYSAYPENSCCIYDQELYRSDGTLLGTGRVKDIWIGEGGSKPEDLTAVGGKIFFVASESSNPRRLWMSDGTASGTVPLSQIAPDIAGSPSDLTRVGDSLFFEGYRAPFGVELWQTDGTREGTALVQDITTGGLSSYPERPMVAGHRVFFVSNDDSGDRELWTMLLPLNEGPVAHAGGPYTRFRNQPLMLSGALSFDPDGDSLTYAWNFGDGTLGSSVSPSHAFSTPGTYVVSLVVSDGAIASAAATAAVTVQNRVPVAHAGGPYVGFRGQEVALTGAGSTDPDGDSLVYQWQFGDGATGTGASPTHAYASLGTYPVTLIVNDGFANSAAVATTVVIENQIPVTNAGGPYSAVRNQSIVFQGTASVDGDRDPLTYLWDFGDGATGTGASPTHAYATLGTYPVTLIVNDGFADSAAVATTVVIENQSPVASAGGPYSGVRNEGIVFQGTASSDGDGDPLTYLWNFGDGATGTGASPTHAYASLGTYPVTLVVNDGFADSAAAATTVVIENQIPVTNAGGPYSAVRNQSIVFQGTASVDGDGDPLTYLWDFGDGATGTGASPTHAYAALGTYPVTLVVNDGFADSIQVATTAVIENVPPVVGLVSPVNGSIFSAPAGIPLAAHAADSDGSIALVEFFADAVKVGEDGTGPYEAAWFGASLGVHILSARVTDDTGAFAASAPVSIFVNAPPLVILTAPSSGMVYTAPASLALSADASDLDGNIVKVEFFQGSMSLGADTTSPFSVSWGNVSAGDYTLTAHATDDRGAVTTSAPVSVTVEARLQPLADAYVRDGSSYVNRNFGGFTTLQVRRTSSSSNNRWAYLRFDTNGVGSAERALLRLYGNLSGTTSALVTTSVFPVSDTSWGELGITWSNKPPPGTSSLSTVTLVSSSTAARWYEWDLTAYVQQEKAAGRHVIGIVLRNDAVSSPYASFSSKDAAGTRPELVVRP